jgi:DedD protein
MVAGQDFVNRVKEQQKQLDEEKKRKIREEVEQEELKAQVDNFFSDNSMLRDQKMSEEEISKIEEVTKVPEEELGDISLPNKNKSKSNINLNPMTKKENNNKKYLILGGSLVGVFALILVGVKMMKKEPKQAVKPAPKAVEIKQDKVVEDDISIDEKYQKLVQKEKDRKLIDKKDDSIDVDKIVKKTKPITTDEVPKTQKQKPKEVLKKDIFGLKSNSQAKQTIKKPKVIERKKPKELKTILNKPKKVVKKAPLKKVVKNPYKKTMVIKKPKVIDFSKGITTIKPNGYFIQIGSFSKVPSDKFLQRIISNRLRYKLYRVKVGNRLYTKLLIGPYVTKNQAKRNLSSVRRKLNSPSAYILRF